MKLSLIKLIILLISFVLLSVLGFNFLITPATVRAFGELEVDFHVPLGIPIFNLTNMAPNDSVTKTIDIHNNDTIKHQVFVKGIKTSGIGTDPKIETVLEIVIKENNLVLYGPKTIKDFLNESNSNYGIHLTQVNSNSDKTLIFEVMFPTHATNEFQNKSAVFDLVFGVLESKNVLINEVFYNVDSNHGSDSPADNGQTVNGLSLGIINNGTGSINNIFVDIENNCTIYQVNNLNSSTNINVNQNTGYNKSNKNNGDGQSAVNSGSISSNINLSTIGNLNKGTCHNLKNKSRNHEWIELYNPTDKNVNLKNYTISDNSGLTLKINGNKILHAGKFALISKDNSTWSYWNEPTNILKIALNKQIGDGLNDTGDHLILKKSDGIEIDRMSWGNDTAGFNPPGTNPQVNPGASTERLAPGFDTDAVSDWQVQEPPSPGN